MNTENSSLHLSQEKIAEVRLACVEMANRWAEKNSGSITPRDVVSYARDLADFVLGTNDAETHRAERVLKSVVSDALRPDPVLYQDGFDKCPKCGAASCPGAAGNGAICWVRV